MSYPLARMPSVAYSVSLINGSDVMPLKDGFNSISDAKITFARNSIASLKFTMFTNHQAYDEIFPFTSLVVVRDRNSETVFEGRVLDPNPAMDTKGSVSREVTCESIEAFLKDSRMPYIEERQWSASDSRSGLQVYIDTVLDYHNAKVEPYKRIYRGVVDLQTHETSDGVYKGIQRESAHDALFKKLVGVYGGEMRVRRDVDGVLRLDYSERLGRIRGTPIQVGKNIKSSSQDFDFASVVTRLTPLGAKLEDSDDRVTIASVNSGVEYVDNDELIATYGIIEDTETWDDVTEPANLLRKAQESLAERTKIPRSVKISALDLSLIGLEPDSLDLLDWYQCINPLIGLNDTLEVVKKTLDLNKPASSTFEFGAIATSQSQSIAEAKQVAAKAAERANEKTQVSTIPIEWLESNVDLGR